MKDNSKMALYASQTNIGVYIAYVAGDVNNYNYGMPKIANQERSAHHQTETTEDTDRRQEESSVCTMPSQLTNDIFRTVIKEGELDMQELWLWIDSHFIKRLTYQYDWMALWRILIDKKLIRNSRWQTRQFVDQMEAWFPDAPVKCDAASINLYRSGYLGDHAYIDWNEEDFEEYKKGKQHIEGFHRLHELCKDLSLALQPAELVK